MMENRIILLLISLLIVVGAWLRLGSLGTQQLTREELPYHFAAQTVRGDSTSSPAPPGASIARGRAMIGSIAFIRGIAPDPETSSRLPSALIGTFAIPLFAALVWLVAGPWTALVATFMFAFYPEAIRQSRTAGLYSTQQTLGLIALCAGWLATARAGPRLSSTPLDLVRRWFWTGACLTSFAAAGLAHLSAGTVFAAFSIWVLLLAALAVWISGPSTIKNNLAVQLVIVGICGVITIVIAKPDVLNAMVHKLTSAPMMLPTGTGITTPGVGFYVFSLASQFAWAFTLLPLVALLAFRRHIWLGAYLVLWFVVPLVMHSLFVTRKEERLLLLATPALFLLAGIAAHAGRESLVQAVNLYVREWLPTYRSAIRAGSAIAWLVLGTALITLPAVIISFRSASGNGAPTGREWNALRGVLAEAPNSGAVPLGGEDPLASLLYLGRGDFNIGTPLGLLSAEQAALLPAARFNPAVDSIPRENRSGAFHTPSLARLREAYLPYGEVHLVIDSRLLDSAAIDPTLRDALDDHGTELCRGRCGYLRLYRLALSS